MGHREREKCLYTRSNFSMWDDVLKVEILLLIDFTFNKLFLSIYLHILFFLISFLLCYVYIDVKYIATDLGILMVMVITYWFRIFVYSQLEITGYSPFTTYSLMPQIISWPLAHRKYLSSALNSYYRFRSIKGYFTH